MNRVDYLIALAKSRREETNLHYAIVQRGECGSSLTIVEHRRKSKYRNAIKSVIWSTKYEEEKNAYLSEKLSRTSN